jgi:hypothetical protein
MICCSQGPWKMSISWAVPGVWPAREVTPRDVAATPLRGAREAGLRSLGKHRYARRDRPHAIVSLERMRARVTNSSHSNGESSRDAPLRWS